MCMYNDCNYCWYSSLSTCHYWYKAFLTIIHQYRKTNKKHQNKTHTHTNIQTWRNRAAVKTILVHQLYPPISRYIWCFTRFTPPCIIIKARTNHQSTGVGRLTQPQSQLGSLQNPVSSLRVAWWGFPLNDWDSPQYICISSTIPQQIINQKNLYNLI